MGYVESIRKYVGHAPIFFCGAGVLIFNQKGQVLLQKRSDDGTWGNPGGALEFGETIYDAAIRETKEETNLDIKKEDLKLFKIYSGEEGHHVYPNGDEAYIVSIMFETNVYEGEMHLETETLDLKFFDIDKLPDNLCKLFIPVARDLKLRAKGDSSWQN